MLSGKKKIFIAIFVFFVIFAAIAATLSYTSSILAEGHKVARKQIVKMAIDHPLADPILKPLQENVSKMEAEKIPDVAPSGFVLTFFDEERKTRAMGIFEEFKAVFEFAKSEKAANPEIGEQALREKIIKKLK